MTDNEIIKALEDTLHRIKGAENLIVPKEGVENLCNGLKNTLDLINRLQAENERLRKNLNAMTETMAQCECCNLVKLEAYKEFAEKLKEKPTQYFYETY